MNATWTDFLPETLTGLATIRAYGEQVNYNWLLHIMELTEIIWVQDRAIQNANHGLDMQNRTLLCLRSHWHVIDKGLL